MTQDQAVRRLYELIDEAGMYRISFDHGKLRSDLIQKKFEAAGIIASYLGSSHYLVTKLDQIQLGRTALAMISIQGESITDEFIGIVRAAINLLGVTYGRPAPKPPIADAELWEHVEELVRNEAWGKVPGEVVRFVEDWYRRHGGNPPNPKGGKLVGTDLFNRVLTDYPLGGEASERDGWRFLAMGLAQAVGNPHRHNIEHRDDAEQFAWSVIGLGSLLIGEARQAYPATNADT